MRSSAFLLASAALVGACSLLSLPETDGTEPGLADGSAPADGSVAPPPPTDGSTPDADAAIAESKYAATVRADGPKLWLRLDDKPGDPAKDEMGGAGGQYETNGVTYGVPTAIAGDKGTAIAFAGSGSRIAMPAGFDFSGFAPYTLEAWLKPVVADAGTLAFVLDHNYYAPLRQGWDLAYTGDGVAHTRWSAPVLTGTSAPFPQDGGWHHVAITFDGTKVKTYVDAVLGETTSTTHPIVYDASAPPWNIGKQNCSPGCAGPSFVGAIDEIALYDKALLDVQIKAHYDAAR